MEHSMFFIELSIFHIHRSIPPIDQSITFIPGSLSKARRSYCSILASLCQIHRRQERRQGFVLGQAVSFKQMERRVS
jgi:hypothetical protein